MTVSTIPVKARYDSRLVTDRLRAIREKQPKPQTIGEAFEMWQTPGHIVNKVVYHYVWETRECRGRDWRLVPFAALEQAIRRGEIRGWRRMGAVSIRYLQEALLR